MLPAWLQLTCSVSLCSACPTPMSCRAVFSRSGKAPVLLRETSARCNQPAVLLPGLLFSVRSFAAFLNIRSVDLLHSAFGLLIGSGLCSSVRLVCSSASRFLFLCQLGLLFRSRFLFLCQLGLLFRSRFLFLCQLGLQFRSGLFLCPLLSVLPAFFRASKANQN